MTLSPSLALEGERKMQLSLPFSMSEWIKNQIPYRGGNEFARQCIALGQELHRRGLVTGFNVNADAVMRALDAHGALGASAAPAPTAPAEAAPPQKKKGKRG